MLSWCASSLPAPISQLSTSMKLMLYPPYPMMFYTLVIENTTPLIPTIGLATARSNVHPACRASHYRGKGWGMLQAHAGDGRRLHHRGIAAAIGRAAAVAHHHADRRRAARQAWACRSISPTRRPP